MDHTWSYCRYNHTFISFRLLYVMTVLVLLYLCYCDCSSLQNFMKRIKCLESIYCNGYFGVVFSVAIVHSCLTSIASALNFLVCLLCLQALVFPPSANLSVFFLSYVGEVAVLQVWISGTPIDHVKSRILKMSVTLPLLPGMVLGWN